MYTYVNIYRQNIQEKELQLLHVMHSDISYSSHFIKNIIPAATHKMDTITIM